MVLQNMNKSAEPCEDFYNFACGGFDRRIVIPDDRSSRSQFAIVGDELLQQLRVIMEIEEKDTGSVFSKAKDVYKACMDEELIESTGLDPLKKILREMGGWPVLEGVNWDENSFSWMETVYPFRRHGYSTD